MQTRRADLRRAIANLVNDYVRNTMVFTPPEKVTERKLDADRTAHEIARKVVELFFHEAGMRAQKRQRNTR